VGKKFVAGGWGCAWGTAEDLDTACADGLNGAEASAAVPEGAEEGVFGADGGARRKRTP